jgi:hypothetical protein
VAYAVENALFQWEDGARRLRQADDRAYELEAAAVLDDLRRRLGSEFTIQELSDLYGSDPDWRSPAVPSWVVDAAFALYAREASDFGGGQARR